ncbi:glycosyltransferase family 2 protein [Gracilimonas sp.]|uniref:glycosyltransferase family 2 protein n=1 Tax=Gracilimonas sp. TaxID=1974203 RepID=UPI002872502A|nr:glycosyltransferase family 2 protein [Gracilimonas sp.]
MATTPHFDVSVIIVNYHSLDDVNDCIKSILEQTTSSLSFEVIIVSNSEEQEQDIDIIKSIHKDITYFSTGENAGFAKANNIGANIARGEYLFILNPDTLLLNDVLGLFYKKMESAPPIGLIAPCMYNQNLEPYPSVIGDIKISSLISLAIPFGALLFYPPNRHKFYLPKQSGAVDVVQGSALFLSSQLYSDVKGMGEEFFMYSEERDLCLKVRKAGYSVFYYQKAKVKHIGGTSTSKSFLKMEVQKHRSKKIFIKKYYPNLIFLNRLCGSFGYFWRFITALITLKKKKFKQFGTLFKWYLLTYK